jgi:transcription factor C subunit 3
MGGAEGWDAGVIRDRIVGKFWRRPMESYLTRLTDDWEATQPPHLRHLAIIRDTRNTQEKKFVHYVYRTHGNFQKAVDAGEVIWAGVSKPAPKQSSAAKGGRPKKDVPSVQVDAWGFRALNSKDFVDNDGSASLSTCRKAIVKPRLHGPRWDNSLIDDVGYEKAETPKSEKANGKSKPKASVKDLSFPHTPRPESPATPGQYNLMSDAVIDGDDATPVAAARVLGLPKLKHENGLLTIDQRVALGLKPKGRLSKFVEDQIRDHRKRTGEPTSIPESIVLERPSSTSTTPILPKSGPLMSKEERIAAGLPARGRLGQKIEDQLRQQRGLPIATKVKKPRKSRPANEPALLSKEQRIKLGIIPHGRLPQSLMEGLREERDFEISFEKSKVIPAYLNAVKDKLPKLELTRAIDEVRVQTMRENDPSNDPTRGSDDSDDDAPISSAPEEPALTAASASTPAAEKRKADEDTSASQPPKRLRIEREESTEEISAAIPTPPSTASDANTEPAREHQEQAESVVATTEEIAPAAASSPQDRQKTPTPPRESSPLIIDLAAVDEKIRAIKEKYNSRSSPGVYFNPFAKRKIGQGRPRNAYNATFRLNGLKDLEWFRAAASVVNETVSSSLRREVSSPEQEVETEEQGLDDHERDEVITPSTSAAKACPEPNAKQSISGENDVLAPQADAMETNQLEVQEMPDHAGVHRDTPATIERTSPGSQSPETTQSVQQYARPVAGWNAINKPLQTESSYQSPYATANSVEPAYVDEKQPEDDTAEQETQEDASSPSIQGVCGPIKEEDTMSRSASKLAAYMGTKTGGGSQKMFRHKIIMQIIDLCDGVYPMHGEIGRPFTTLWKQQYPNVAPPNSSTVLSNLRDMIADPRNGLKKFSFLIRLRQSAGLKKKDMVVYQHLTPTSPQVTKLAYKMANYSSTKAHQYYPEEILHLVSDESFYVPMPVAPKDETVSLERLNPSLKNKIKEANLARRRRYYHKQKNEELARDAQNLAVEAPLKQAANVDGQPRAKRARLASLNDKNKRYRRAPLTAPSTPLDPELEESIAEEVGAAEDEPQQGRSLTWKEPWVGPAVGQPEASANTAPTSATIEYYVSSITAPIVRFYPTNGTFSTEFGLAPALDLFSAPLPARLVDASIAPPKGRKRVRIIEPASQQPNKKVRRGTDKPVPVTEANLVISPSDESDVSYSSDTSSTSSDSEDDVPLMQLSKAQAKARAKAKAKAKAKKKAKAKRGSKKDPPPTLLERLTGLTGDPNEPVYLPPKQRLQRQKKYQGWIERKNARSNKQQRERKYAESQDPVDSFKKLFCTLIIASCMAGETGNLDWSIVEKVHDAKGFDIAKTKVLWDWMRTNMAQQITDLTNDFEARFLEAYEDNRIAAIEDPSKYDWANLVRWAMHTCVYPELSLPVYREALQQFIVDLSNFEALDRPKWYRERIADRVRTQLQLQYPFTTPLHTTHTQRTPVDETELKARSWIRANTATPQGRYDSKTAHGKLRTLGDPVLAKVVGEYVDRQMLRMRKLKRLLPGRNYTFTARLAKKYGRTFELSDFMAAVKIKKDMDAAFTSDDPEKRIYSVSRAEPDGAIMAIMSLLSGGKVAFAPQVPAVNNEFGAPLPRLSVWGFMEGDYVHRGIDRQRLFWDIHVVPTKTYDYGNPLQPTAATHEDTTSNLVEWLPLPEPPLPGKHDVNALLPIWSSMDGQNVTWPWWYRILNLVLQPLIFQPGATVEDIHANCDEYTTEIFEIQLVLQWLESVNAVKKTIGGGYVTLPGVWAAFGDILHDLEDDWLNAHVKRKHKKHEKQQWRDKYHLRYSTLQDQGARPELSDDEESDAQSEDELEGATSASADIMRHPKEQYAIVRDQIASAAPESSAAGISEQGAESEPVPEGDANAEQTPGVAAAVGGDVDMQDASDAGELDAEGELEV